MAFLGKWGLWMDTITTTIKREWLREIVAGRKRVEYREIKPYWERRFSQVAPRSCSA